MKKNLFLLLFFFPVFLFAQVRATFEYKARTTPPGAGEYGLLGFFTDTDDLGFTTDSVKVDTTLFYDSAGNKFIVKSKSGSSPFLIGVDQVGHNIAPVTGKGQLTDTNELGVPYYSGGVTSKVQSKIYVEGMEIMGVDVAGVQVDLGTTIREWSVDSNYVENTVRAYSGLLYRKNSGVDATGHLPDTSSNWTITSIDYPLGVYDTLQLNTDLSSTFIGNTVSRIRKLNVKTKIDGSAVADVYIDIPSNLDGELSITSEDISNNYKGVIRAQNGSYFSTGDGRKISEYYLSDGETVFMKPSPSGVFITSNYRPRINGRQDIPSTRYNPCDRININGGWYDVSTYPIYGYSSVDTIISIPTSVKEKTGENIFIHTIHFWDINKSGSRWANLSSHYTVVENDTIHPITKKRTVPKFTLFDATSATLRYNTSTLDGYYQPDSTYTISFWARQGKDAASSNANLAVILQYGGNPDVSSGLLNITPDWNYYQVELTAFDVSRIFTGVDFLITGDIGDNVYITDPKLERGSSISGQEFYPTMDSVFVNQRLFANLPLVNATWDYDMVKGALGNDDVTLNYLSQKCQGINGCNYIYSATGFTLKDQLLMREGVKFVGSHTGVALTGSGSDSFQGARIKFDLQDTTKVGIQATGPSQIDGIGVKGFIFEIVSGLKAAIGTGDALDAQFEDITFLGSNDSLLYGMLFESGSLDCNVNNVSTLGKYAGFYGTSSLLRMDDCKYLGGAVGADITGGNWELYSCWFEDLDSTAIRYNSLGSELKVVDLYIEHVPQATSTGIPMFDIKAAKNVEFTRCNLGMQPGVDATNNAFEIDTVGIITLKNNDFGQIGGLYVNATDRTGSIIAIGNNHTRSTGFFNYDTWEGIPDSCSVVAIGNALRNVTATVVPDKNWIGCFETTGFKLRDGLLVGYDGNEIQGEILVRSDTIVLVGTQNLVRYSEQLNQSVEWNDIGGTMLVTTDDATSGDPEAELIVRNTATDIRINGITDAILKPETAYTFRYKAKIPSGGATMILRPEFDVPGGVGDKFGKPDTITTSWDIYTQTIISPTSDHLSGAVIDFVMTGDSVWLTEVSVTEGYFNEAYVETGATNILKKEVVFNGEMTVTGDLNAIISYDNSISGLSSANQKDAIDELAGRDAGDIPITDLAGGYASAAVEGALQELTMQTEIAPSDASTIAVTKYRCIIAIDNLEGSTQTQTINTANIPDGAEVFIKSNASVSVTFSLSSGNFVPLGSTTGQSTIAISGTGELKLLWSSDLNVFYQLL